MTQLRLTK